MKLKSWGANNYGQLGLGFFTEQCNEPRDVELNYSRIGEIVSISGGGGHTIISNDDGRLYGCGLNNFNQLTSGHTNNVSTFTELEFITSQIGSQIVCAWESTLLLSREGYLLVWGSNSYGQLGIKKDKDKKSISATHLPISRVAQVSCGLRHTAVLLDSGQLFVCGQGRKGQLGIVKSVLPVSETDELLHVSELSNVKSVACGQNHTIALTVDGCLYAWGDNKHGQLGLNPLLCNQTSTPQLIRSDVPLNTKLYAGWTHSVLLKDDGSVLNCGRNSYGQLGCVANSRNNYWTLDKLQCIKPARQLAVGTEHNLVISDDGDVWSWGWNEHGSCGLGHQENVFNPTQVKFSSSAVRIGSGSAHCFALFTD